MPAAGEGQALQTFKLCCQVDRGLKGGAGLTLHSGIKLHNSCGLLLSIGMQQRWPGSATDHQAWTTCHVSPGSSAWLPTLCCNATYLSLQPAGQSRFAPPLQPLEMLLRHQQALHSLMPHVLHNRSSNDPTLDMLHCHGDALHVLSCRSCAWPMYCTSSSSSKASQLQVAHRPFCFNSPQGS